MALEEELELDLANALRGIDSIEQALGSATTQFKVDISDALNLLSGVRVEADATPLQESVADALNSADLSVDPTIDQDALLAELAGLSAEIDVDVAADGVAGDIEAALADADTTVEIDADTSAAEDQIENLGDKSSGAAGATTDLSGAVAGLGTAASAAGGNLSGIIATLGSFNAKAATAAAAALALSAAGGILFGQALEADTATQRFNRTLGDSAKAVDNINIGGLNESITELATRVGSSDEAMQLAAARIFALGSSAGVAAPELEATTEQILALSARAVALNPTLGDAGQVAETLSTALARGGRATAAFGISLTAAEIEARALRDTGKETSTELTNYDKAAAGAAITTERLGDSLSKDINAGAATLQVQFRALQEEFGNTLEVFGQPLLRPLLDTAKLAQPILLNLAQMFGEVIVAVLPLVQSLLPALDGGLGGVGFVVSGLVPVLGGLASVIDSIPEPLLRALGTFLALRAGLGPIPGLVTGVITSLVSASTAAGGIGAALTTALGPVGIAAIAITGLITVLSVYKQAQAEANAATEAAAAAFEDASASIQEDVKKLIDTKLVDEHQLDDLHRLGVSYDDVGRIIRGSGEDIDKFVEKAISSGEITIIDPATGAKIDSAREAFEKYGATSTDIINQDKVLVQGNTGLLNSLGSLQAQYVSGAEQTLAAAEASGKYTKEQIAAAKASATQAGGAIDYFSALQELEGITNQASAAQEELNAQYGASDAPLETTLDKVKAINEKLGEQSTALDSTRASLFTFGNDFERNLGQKFIDGTAVALDYVNAIDKTGGSFEDLKSIEEDLTGQVDSLSGAITQSFAGIDQAFNDLEEGEGLQPFLDNLTKQVTDTSLFLDNIQSLIDRGAVDLAAALAPQGAAAAGAAAEANNLNDAQLARREEQIDKALAVEEENRRRADQIATDYVSDQVRHNAEQVPFTIKPVDATAFKSSLDVTKTDAFKRANGIGEEVNRGIAVGAQTSLPDLLTKVRGVASSIVSSVREALGIKSPSKVGQLIGENFNAGIALGLAATSGIEDAAAGVAAVVAATAVPSSAVVPAFSGSASATPVVTLGPSAGLSGASAGTTVQGPLFGAVTFNEKVDPVTVFQEAAFAFVEGSVSPT